MCGQLIGIYLATILDLFSDYRYKEKALRAACFRTWSLVYSKVSRQSLQARAAVSARFRQYEVGQTWWANVSAAGASSSTLTRASSRSCFGGKKRQRKRRPAEAQKTQRQKRALALLSTAPARQRGAANDAHHAALRARVSSMPWPRPLLQYCRPGPK